ncbi:MAG: hypothetical protein C4545_02645 [Anaerolineaceae bacterium]|nr:MAG: hypothetical protein C4545_02645 [Anaerolineaceae bacterium]
MIHLNCFIPLFRYKFTLFLLQTNALGQQYLEQINNFFNEICYNKIIGVRALVSWLIKNNQPRRS